MTLITIIMKVTILLTLCKVLLQNNLHLTIEDKLISISVVVILVIITKITINNNKISSNSNRANKRIMIWLSQNCSSKILKLV